MGRNVTQQLIESHLVGGDMSPGSGDRAADRSDPDPGRHRHAGDAGARGAGPGPGAHRGLACSTSTTTCCRPTSSNAEDHAVPPLGRAAASGCGTPSRATASRIPTHMQRFGAPGKTMVGSDSHTLRCGSLGMLAIGVGGLEVALAIAGKPLHIRMPRDLGRRLTGELRSVVLGEGRDPGDAAPPRRQGRTEPDHRVPRPRAGRR